jgi:hypothetical protein
VTRAARNLPAGAARPLNPTAASLLGFLHAGPMTGWDLVATAETLIGDFWSLTRSQVYREPGPEQIRYPLLLTIAFGRHLPTGRLAEFVAAHRVVHAARLEGYRELRGSVAGDPYALATLDFGMRYEQAVLDWFDSLPPEIKG